MFKKLLKYDARSVAKYWWIAAVATLALAVVAGVSIRTLVLSEMKSMLLSFSCMATVSIAMIGIVTACTFTFILIYYRFYRNFFSDEGYLTFTLPVTRKELYLSKTLNALIFLLAQGLLCVISLLIAMLLIPIPLEDGVTQNLLALALQGFQKLFSEIPSPLWMVLYGFEGLLMMLSQMLFSIGLYQFCITFGAVVAKKYKILAAIGIYFAVTSVLPFISQMFLPLIITFGEDWFRSITLENLPYVVALIFFGLILIESALAFLAHVLTYRQIEKKLNLP